MPTIPGGKREKGVRYLIDHDFDVDLGIQFLIRECADEPKMKAAKDQRVLARNILTIKGSGAEKELNWMSWRNAIIKYGEDMARQKENQFKTELDKKDDKIRELEAEVRSLNRDNRDFMRRSLTDGSEAQARPHEGVPDNVPLAI